MTMSVVVTFSQKAVNKGNFMIYLEINRLIDTLAFGWITAAASFSDSVLSF